MRRRGTYRVGAADKVCDGAGAEVKYMQLVSGWELRAIPVEVSPAAVRPIQNPEDALALLRPMLVGLDHERLVVLHVGSAYRLLGYHEAARGEGNTVSVSPRQILRPVLYSGAIAFIMAHNHPSGDSTPSEPDHDLTRRIASASEIAGVKMLDHLVIGAGSDYYSYSAAGSLR